MANDLIAALERAAHKADYDAKHYHCNQSRADATFIRNHIADLRNGDERAKVMAYLRRVGLTQRARDLFATAAGHIEAGAHMGGNDADCPPTDAKGYV